MREGLFDEDGTRNSECIPSRIEEPLVPLWVQDILATEEAQFALQDSASNLQAIFKHTAEGFVLVDRDGIIKAVNRKGLDFIFLNSATLTRIGASIYEYIEVARHEAFKEFFGKALRGEAVTYNRAFLRNGGETCWFNFTLNPVYHAGKVDGVCVSGRDITDHFKAQHALEESERKYRKLYNQLEQERGRLLEAQSVAKIGSWEFDLKENKVVYWSNEVFQIAEIDDTAQRLSYEAMLALVHPDDTGYVRAAFEVSLKTPGSYTIEHRLITAKGNIKQQVVIWRVIYDRAGQPDRITATFQDITDRKKTEEENEFKAKLLNIIGQAVIAGGVDGTVKYWNKAAETLYGWTEEEALGNNLLSLIPEFGTEGDMLQIMEQVPEGGSWSGEMRASRKDGRTFPVFVTCVPIYDAANKMAGIIGVSTDITEKKKLEDLLEKASSIARIGAWEADLATGKVFWSRITRDIHEVDDDFVPTLDCIGQFYKEGEGKEAIRSAAKRAVAQHRPFDLELPIVTAKGNERWIRVIGEAVVEGGSCVQLYGSLQDIHDRKTTRLQLERASEDRSQILESIGDAFYALDRSWRVTYWNKKAELALSALSTEVVGKVLWEAFPGTFDSALGTNYRLVVQDNTARQFEFFYEPLEKWYDISAYPSPKGISVYFKDITEKKNSEIEYVKMVDDIVQRNKDLEQFSYIVSHNLRAPAANIIGLAAELHNEQHEEPIKTMFLEKLAQNVSRLDNVMVDLNTILSVKREVSETRESVNLPRLVENITSSISDMIQREGVQVKTYFTELADITTIRSYIHSILYNLIFNSIKYRRSDVQPVIEITTVRSAGKLLLTVQDNGSGIDLAAKADQLFGLYKRFHANIEGKGMGLIMVKTQVETLGGRISASSEVGKGTRFEIELPLNN